MGGGEVSQGFFFFFNSYSFFFFQIQHGCGWGLALIAAGRRALGLGFGTWVSRQIWRLRLRLFRREEHRVRSSGTWCLFLCVKEVKLMWCWSPGPVVSVRLEVASSFIYLIIERDLCLLWTEDWPVKDRKEEQEAERWRSCSIICNKKAASSSVAAVIWKKNQAESCGKNRLCEEIVLQVKKKDRGEKRAAPIGSSCVYTAEYVAVVEEWKYRREKKISKNYFSWFLFFNRWSFCSYDSLV